jgi:hypothetical protein
VTEHKKKWHRPVGIDVKKQLWFCNDCKLGGTVIDWLMREKGCDAAQAMRELGGGGNNSEPHGKIVEAYDYNDKDGKLRYQICRKDPKSDFPVRRPDGHGGWIWNLQGEQRFLYRLPEVLKAQTVCAAEGEKDCDNLARLGFVATTNPFGAGKWRDEYSETLRGKDVAVFGDVGDPDKKGEKHTAQVIESLSGKAKSIKHVVLPEGFHDVSDYIASLPHETARDTIAKLIEETPTIEVQSQEAPEPPLPPPSPPYVPPPLDLLPPLLQKFVRVGAAANDVDISFVFLPVLSELGACIGISRSVRIKEGWIQPPIVWTSVVAASGDGKDPGMRTAIRAQLLHEMKLKRENDKKNAKYEKKLAAWEATPKPKRTDVRPKKPAEQVCWMDDATIEAVARRLNENARGILLAKAELSHWFASFDQYRDKGGSDVARWLQLYDGDLFAVDRVTGERCYRILNPRICIASGVQPDRLGRLLTPEYFERGLPARLFWAMPKRKGPRKYTKKVVWPELFAEVAELFSKLRSSEPDQIKTEQDEPEDDEEDEQEQKKQDRLTPKLLPLSPEAERIFTAFYDEVGQIMYDAAPRLAAQWSKLIGGSARLALVGQLAHDPNAKEISGEMMKHAVALARWFGREAERIFSQLAETPEQREQRDFVEFIERRGRTVTVRDVITYYRPLRNNRDEAERRLNALVRAGYGEWKETKGARGPATREFHLLHVSASAGSENPPSIEQKPADADSPNSQENNGVDSSVDGAVPGGVDATTSLPVMITKRMEADLQTMGYSQAEIDKMTSAQANDILAGKPVDGPGDGRPLVL